MKRMNVANYQSGFTLIETIIYIGLFSLIFSGIFLSIYPIFTGAERLTHNIATEGESAFILAKIDYALATAINDTNGVIISPVENDDPTNELVIANTDGTYFRFVENEPDASFCSIPLKCNTLTMTYDEDEDDPPPLNTQRVTIKDFLVEHKAEYDEDDVLLYRYLDVSFKTGDDADDVVGPVRYYLHF